MEDDDGNDIDLDGVLTQLERTIPLVKKAREQARRIEDLENTVRALRQRVAELEAEKRPSSSSSASSAPSSPDCMKCRILEHTFRSDDYSLRMSSPPSSSRTVPMYMENGVDARRPRSSSDEGGVQAYFSQFRRVCSFQPIGNNNPCKKCQATTTREEQRIATTASAAVSTSTTGDMADHGVNSLEDYTIENRDGMAEARSGYRLLTCNDDTCFLEEIHSGLVHFPHLTKLLVKFKWIHSPKTVLLVKKPRELDCTRMLESVARFYIQQGLRVVVEKAIMTPCSAAEESILFDLKALGVVATEKHEIQNLPVDFCVCIGGDGTIIWASHLFPKGCPPFVSIAMGSLGFLSTFSVESSRDALRKVLKEEMVLTLRSRLEAHVIRKTGEETRLETVLNEVVVDRGPHSSIVNLDLFIGSSDTPVTHVQGDGLIISTPTGSTAYSLAAGGSMIHPSIPCVAVTPICPHSLSFRPIVISDTSTIRLVVPEIARSGAYVSFDGRHQIELHQGDELVIKVSEFPVPCVCSQGESLDWFRAIKHGFKWNERTIQKKHDGDIPSAL